MAIMVLVAVTLSAMIMEGAGIYWAALYIRDVFAASPFLSGFAVALGAGAQAVTRFFADPFVERYSPTAVARLLLGVLGVCVLLVFFAPSDGLALVGFALTGVGTSVIFPLAMSAAAQLTDRPAPTNVALLAQVSFVAFLLGPPLLGYIAEHFSIRWSFGVGLHITAREISAKRIRSVSRFCIGNQLLRALKLDGKFPRHGEPDLLYSLDGKTVGRPVSSLVCTSDFL
jgi:MFS family permease